MASIKLAGDTSGEITISAPAVAGTTTLELPATSSTLATQNALGVRNLIINGDMRIAQRGTSVSGITGAGYHTCDRFDTGGTGFGTYTQSQDTDVPTGQGFANSIKFLWTTANASLSASSFLQMHQSIEGQNLQHLKKGTANAESTTLSFWVKSNKTGTYIVNLWDIDNTRLIAKSYTVNTADTWEKKTLTFAGDTVIGFDNDNGRSLDLTFGLCAGTDNSSGTLQTTWGAALAVNRYVGQVNLADAINNYINFTGIQLEVGDTATPFEHRPYDMELARCQRYYENFGTEDDHYFTGAVACSSSTRCRIGINYTQKRTAPTITVGNTDLTVFTGAANITSTAVAVSSVVTTKAAFLQIDVASGLTSGEAELVKTNNTSNPVEIDAEL